MKMANMVKTILPIQGQKDCSKRRRNHREEKEMRNRQAKRQRESNKSNKNNPTQLSMHSFLFR